MLELDVDARWMGGTERDRIPDPSALDLKPGRLEHPDVTRDVRNAPLHPGADPIELQQRAASDKHWKVCTNRLCGEKLALAHRADRAQGAQRIPEVEHQASADDDVKGAELRGREVVHVAFDLLDT